MIMMLTGLFHVPSRARIVVVNDVMKDTIAGGDTLLLQLSGTDADPGQVLLRPDETKKKKFVSALFAFPFPFGFMGAHRVMLGTKPWVPVVYVATFGGCFGLLPMIDFFVITFSKDISQYENNPHIFMWVTSPAQNDGNPE
jgi:TM2 domain-containing membrane protein YozV